MSNKKISCSPKKLGLHDMTDNMTNTHTEYIDLPRDQRLPCCYVVTCRGVPTVSTLSYEARRAFDVSAAVVFNVTSIHILRCTWWEYWSVHHPPTSRFSIQNYSRNPSVKVQAGWIYVSSPAHTQNEYISITHTCTRVWKNFEKHQRRFKGSPLLWYSQEIFFLSFCFLHIKSFQSDDK